MIRALTRRREDDQSLYVRPPNVEAEIAVAIAQDLAKVQKRIWVTDRGSPDYLHSETLVHLVRNAFRSQDMHLQDAVLPVLLGRCATILEVKVRNGLPNATEIREEALQAFSELLAADAYDMSSNELDIYECRFMFAFRTLRASAIGSELNEVNRAVELPEDNDPSEVDGDADFGRNTLAPMPALFSAPSSPTNETFREQLLEAIYKLPADERDAVLLVYFMGYAEESADPKKETAATLCKCEGRTIRNRLTRAAEKLSRVNLV